MDAGDTAAWLAVASAPARPGSAVSPPRRLSVVAPSFTLALTSAAKIDVRAGKGPTGKLTGRIDRIGFPHPVTLSLAGLPQGVTSPTLVVPGDKTDFEFKLEAGLESGDTIATLNGQDGTAELLFLGPAANDAAKLLKGEAL